MDSLLISAKEPIRLSSEDLGTADISLEYCPRAYSKDLLASFPDCTTALKARPECKALLFLAVHKTEMSMASFSPDTEAERESIFKKHLEFLKRLDSLFLRSSTALVAKVSILSPHTACAGGADAASSYALLQCLDPISGTAHWLHPLSMPSNASVTRFSYCSAARGAVFSDTDSLLVSLGLHVADVGCCSILRHTEWGYLCFPVRPTLRLLLLLLLLTVWVQVLTLVVCNDAAARHLNESLRDLCCSSRA